MKYQTGERAWVLLEKLHFMVNNRIRYHLNKINMKKQLYLIMALLAIAIVLNPNKLQASNGLNSADSLLVAEFYKPYIQSKLGNDTIAIRQFIKQEVESLDSCYLIHYKQLINGYDIRMAIKDNYPMQDEVECYGNMIISNGEKAICDTFNIYLFESVYNCLVTHKVNELDYIIETKEDYYSGAIYPHLGQYRKLPFAFFDTDFDGEKELIFRAKGMGQRGRNCYSLIDLIWETPCHWSVAIPDNEGTEMYRYFPFDDMTQFDFKNKLFIFHLSGGVWYNEWHYYKIENEKSKLVKKIIEYYSNDVRIGRIPKVKRITYHDNDSTVTDVEVKEKCYDSYMID